MKTGEIAKRASGVGFLTFMSRIAGLVRDMSVAYVFGTHLAADAFFVAFRIPNLLRRLFAEGALTVSFVPIFTETLQKDRANAKPLADASWTLLLLLLLLVSLVGVLFSPELVKLTAWGFAQDPEKFELTVFLTRITFPYILLVSLAAWAMGVLNSLKHFAVPASSSIFMNLGIIFGALALSRFVDPPVLGLAIGVLIGGLLQLGVHFPILGRLGFFPRFVWNPTDPGVRKIIGMMIPAAYGAAVYQFNVIVITLVASFLPSGSVSYLWYADRLMEFPLGIFAISLATVLLPSFSDHAANQAMEPLKETFRTGLRMIFFITIPAAGGLMVLAEPIIQLLFEHGSFGPASTLHTAHALIFFALGLPFISGVRVTSNLFFSLQDSKTPVKLATVAVGINLLLSLLLMKPMAHNGLALAVSLASLGNFLMQLVSVRKRLGRLGLRQITGGVGKTILATIIMMIGVKLTSEPILSSLSGSLWQEGSGVFLLILLGVLVFLAAELLLKGREVGELVTAILSQKSKRA